MHPASAPGAVDNYRAGLEAGGLLADFAECAVALIVEQAVLTVASDVNIVEAIVVVVAHAHALPPAGRNQSSFHRHIGKCAIVIVAEQMTGGRRAFPLFRIEFHTVYEEDIHPSVAIVIENGNP